VSLQLAVVALAAAALVFAYVLWRRVAPARARPERRAAVAPPASDVRNDEERALALVRTREESLGADDPAVADALGQLAELYASEGRYVEAGAALARARSIRAAALGESHPESIATLERVADVELGLARATRAVSLLEAVISARGATIGADHPDTVVARAELGRALLAARRHDAAVPLLREALDLTIATHGRDHRAVARLYAELGTALDHGRDPEAEAMLARATDTCARLASFRVEGLVPIVALVAASRIASNRPREARALLLDAFALAERSLGADHADAAAALYHAGRASLAAHDPADAAGHFARALEIRLRTLPQGHVDVAYARAASGAALHALGRAEDARRLLAGARPTLERALGREHPALLDMHRTLASLAVADGHDGEALIFLRLALSEATALGGPIDAPAVRDWCALAAVERRAGRADVARSLLEGALEAVTRTRGSDVPELILILQALADVRLGEGNAGAAEELAARSVALAESIGGDTRAKLADSLGLLAAAHSAQGAHAPAAAALRRELAIRGADERRAAGAALRALAAACVALGEHAEADEHLSRALELATGGDDPDGAAATLEQIGELDRRNGRHAAAVRAFERAFSMRERQGSPPLALGRSAAALGRAYAAAGAPGEAAPKLWLALRTLETALGRDHPAIADVLEELGGALVATGGLGDAVQVLERAAVARERDGAAAALAGALELLAGAYASASDPERSVVTLERAIALRDVGGDTERVATDLVRLADAQRELARATDAESALRRALSLATPETGRARLRAGILERLGHLCALQWKLDEAESMLRDALAAWDSASGSSEDRVRVLHSLVRIYRSKGDLAMARQTAERARREGERVLPAAAPR